ncbi:signal peptidase I [Candidatus Woesearchaeota archaeon]|nr:signal peptidase I [Nanoarchaeota archaeon]MCB9370364.1 signal peptidase I [Candidatus Woesearchaeota archaeon]USN44885.1 MAG: signal peptidase I [Candidatus Woesearchaeota archaeon]
MTVKKILLQLKRFWLFIWKDDSPLAYVLNLLFAFLFIKFLFFPAIGFALNTDFPIVAIVSGSMEHKTQVQNIPGCMGTSCICGVSQETPERFSFTQYWQICGSYYETNFNITQEVFATFPYKNGLNTGDVMILYGKDPKDIEVGQVLVFEPGDKQWYANYGPVIHRVVAKWKGNDGKWYFRTKGDHNAISSDTRSFESEISEDEVFGIGLVRIPFIGYVKIVMSKILLTLGGLF